MPIVVGLGIIPIVLMIIYIANLVTTGKRTRVLLNLLLVLIAVMFLIFCYVVKEEPFEFEVYYSAAYMFFSGKFMVDFLVILVFTPFIWIILIHFLRVFLRSVRVRKNAVIKKSADYVYYRGDLDKVSPAIIIFASTLETDMRKSISATLLKLKLTGFIKENGNDYICTKKATTDLLESERMVLELVRGNVFDKTRYKEVVEEETLKSKYLTRNRGGILYRVLKIVLAVCIPIVLLISSASFDEYVFDNYLVYPADDGEVYFWLEDEADVEKLYGEVQDMDDYYHRSTDYGEAYNYNEIRADRMEYGTVRKAFFLHVLDVALIYSSIIVILASLYYVIEQLVYINKNYKRTVRGKALLNKAYALKNYLKDYSLIKDRDEKELELWEYYLVYAVALDVNVKIEDEVIEKYIKTII